MNEKKEVQRGEGLAPKSHKCPAPEGPGLSIKPSDSKSRVLSTKPSASLLRTYMNSDPADIDLGGFRPLFYPELHTTIAQIQSLAERGLFKVAQQVQNDNLIGVRCSGLAHLGDRSAPSV